MATTPTFYLDQRLVGEWENEYFTFVFEGDGTGSFSFHGYEQIHWQIVWVMRDGRLYEYGYIDGVREGEFVSGYTFTANELQLTLLKQRFLEFRDYGEVWSAWSYSTEWETLILQRVR